MLSNHLRGKIAFFTGTSQGCAAIFGAIDQRYVKS